MGSIPDQQDAAVSELLQRLQIMDLIEDQLIFFSRNGTPLTTNNIRRRLRAVLEEAGIEGVTPHSFLRTVATRGEGPGEISGANGMQLVGDTMLWVQDHGKWMMLGLSTAGDEIARVPVAYDGRKEVFQHSLSSSYRRSRSITRRTASGTRYRIGSPAARRKAWLQVSMEQNMGCAVGACLGCVVMGVDGPQRVCREGPVFAADEIRWQGWT